jgi:hypothetical protein
MPRKFNADAFACMAQYAAAVYQIRSEMGKQVTATREAIIQSRGAMAEIDASLAKVATQPGWLWPAY